MSSKNGVVFVFAGHGCQWEGMAVELLDSSPLFAKHMQACEEALAPYVKWSLHDVLRCKPRARKLQRVDVVQPVLFAVSVSLAQLWRFCGVSPDAVVGHSQGEIAAAHIAGGLSLSDAARIVALRSRALSRLSGKGGVLAVSHDVARLTAHIESWGGRLEVAAVNGPFSLAASGDREALEQLLASCEVQGIKAKRVPMDYASHSRQVESIREELVDGLSAIAPRSGEVPLCSTAWGGLLDTAEMGPEYWYLGERRPVQFERAVRVLLGEGHRTFLEVSPHPVLTVAMQETVDEALDQTDAVAIVSSLRRGHGDIDRFSSALAAMNMLGVPVDWQAACSEGLQMPTTAEHRDIANTRRPGQALSECTLTRGMADAPHGELERVVLELVQGEVAAVLGHSSASAVGSARTFKELGLDSPAAVELRNRLSMSTGLRLPATLIFDYPTPAAITGYLLERVTGAQRRVRAPMPTVLSTDEPVAIVGMSCRYPGGVRSPQELWELVLREADAISGFPSDRGWNLESLYDPDPDHPGTSYTREGGFVYDAGEFDPGFFGIGPREALAMDPQQRLLLEACWEAFEDANLDPAVLRGSQTGVYAGVAGQDYGPRLHETPRGLEGYALTGSTASVASGRVAYSFGFEGPAVTVDTACSSSLVALHLASQALRSGECSLALAGGVTVMANPGMFIEFSRQRGLAVDGRCKSFADAADGTGWSEGVGVVLLERLSDARRSGHRVLGLVRGSAINQDGASNGLTAPNGPSQQRVIAQALANARLAPTQVDMVEGHGTGTMLGDPIEAQALLSIYGQDRAEGRPLWLGSVKSNIGHTQAAAGVAGVIKVVMAMRHGVLPRTLHVDEPSRQVDWSAGAVSLLTEQLSWESNGEPRRAGVSSFGVSGTNAHVILEEPPSFEQAPLGDPPSVDGASEVDLDGSGASSSLSVTPWVLSGKSEQALSAQAERLRGHVLEEPAVGVCDVALSLAGRSCFEHRAVLLGADRRELLGALDGLVGGAAVAGMSRGVVFPGRRGGVGLLFTGQGSQRVGMGRELYEAVPVFRDALDEVCEQLDKHLECSLLEVLFGAGASVGEFGSADGPGRLLDETAFTQTGLFALEVALFRLVQRWGVRPDFLLGHSIGELSAAYVAGVFSLEDACVLVATRGRLMGALASGGAMVSIEVSEQEILQSLVGLEAQVALAAVNGPSSVVVSGDEDAVLGVAGGWGERGRRTKRLRVSHAFHSPHMDEMLQEFAAVAEGLSFSEPEIPIVSNLTGGLVSEEICRAEYWVRHVREPVRFMDGVRWLGAQGVHSFLELGPEGVLSAMGQDCLAEQDQGQAQQDGGVGDALDQASFTAVPLLRGGRSEMQTVMGALGEVWVRGVEMDWEGILQGPGVERVPLPTYAFQRERYWLQVQVGAGDMVSAGQASAEHPLLGAMVGVAGGQRWLFTGRISLESHPWLADHVVIGTVLLPGAAYLELALRAGSEVGCERLVELELAAPLVLGEHQAVQIQVSVDEPDEEGTRQVWIYSRLEESSTELGGGLGIEEQWVCNASGVLSSRRPDVGAAFDGGMAALTSGVWPPRDADPVEVDGLYDRLIELGLEYGPVFQGLTAAWRRGDELFAEVGLPEGEREQAGSFGLHPALLDGALHAAGLIGLFDNDGEARDGVCLPFSWGGVSVHALGASSLRVCLSPVVVDGSSGNDGVSLVAVDEDGGLVAVVESLTTRAVSSEHLAGGDRGYQESLFRVDWTPVPLGARAENGEELGEWMLLDVDESRLAEGLRTTGAPVAAYRDLVALGEAVDGGVGLPRVVLLDSHRAIGHAPGVQVSSAEPLEGVGAELPGVAHRVLHDVLGVVQGWLADERFAECRLVVCSEDALAVGAGDGVRGLADAAVWGLVRSAQAENPERLVLVDLDGQPASWGVLREALSVALALGEPQLTIRAGAALAPRLGGVLEASGDVSASKATSADTDGSEDAVPAGFDPARSVLITGGTGGLGVLLTRHLVAEHGIRSVVLASRRGLRADGVDELRRELGELGAQVTVVACDVGVRAEVERLLASVPVEYPLGAVVHAAGVIDDGVVDSLTPERLDGVLAPKLDAAWHLHELTEHLDLSAFLMFSSVAGTLGSPRRASYAAANAFLDALAVQRRVKNLPGMSLAFGIWSTATGITAGRDDTDSARILARLRRSEGLMPLSDAQGLELIDVALTVDEPVLLPVALDFSVLRTQARLGVLAGPLRSLVRVPARRASDAQSSLAMRLAAAPESDWDAIVLGLVRESVASVLGHASGKAIDTTRGFKELGFDSLGAIELRNRLGRATGLRLPSTLVFDYPTPSAVMEYLRSKVEGAERGSAVSSCSPERTDEPIAIVGMGCRYPGGVGSPEGLWELVVSGTDAIGGFPGDRGWDLERLYDPDPDHSGTSYTRAGGFVYDAGEFDAQFFAISPREALAMDPQQRLLLEGSWEALEDAGIDPYSLRGSQTGVFTGVISSEYGFGTSQSEQVEGFRLTGGTASVASGRVAYSFGFEGPAVSVDTACSSSLVAVHLACQALRQGECELALAGGVTVLSTPGVFVAFSRQRGLAPDGRCKSFGADADGTGWGEGVGVVLLERLSDARRSGHRVLGLVRGSAVNQDGASNGLTAPNGPSQERVIAQALASAGLSPSDIDAVEAHGTGTSLGDPIEAQALLATYGQGREHPLWLGSIKSNIGHTQAAAGVAGLIKMVKALQHGLLPKTLHAREPSTHVDWSAGEVKLLSESVPWLESERIRRAGVSSFGISGTNAHLILEQAPEPELVESPAEDQTPQALSVMPFLVSARSPETLRSQAERLRSHLVAHPEVEPVDVAMTLALYRASLEHRAVVLAGEPADLIARLNALACGGSADGLIEDVARSEGGLALMFSGQGSQSPRMGAELYEVFPVFARALDSLCAELDCHLERSMRDVLFAEEGSEEVSLLDQTEFTQPAFFALEVALYRLLESLGVKPDYLIGHSVGEIVAAHVAGVLSLADACTLVVARGRLMGSLPEGGAMLAVKASEQEAREGLEGFQDRISIAAVNAPEGVVLSGERDAIDQLEAHWREQGRKTTRLRVSHAFHSPLMEPVLEEFHRTIQTLTFNPPRIAIVSNVSGELAGEELNSPDYWVRHVRETVRFGEGITVLEAAGVTRFLEVGPDGVLSAMAAQCLSARAEEQGVLLVPMLRARRSELETLAGLLAHAHAHGVEVDWKAFFGGRGAHPVELPTYAFQRKRYWLSGGTGSGDAGSLGLGAAEHPLLGAALDLAGQREGWAFTGRLSTQSHPWVKDHAVMDTVLLPGTAFLELALAAAERTGTRMVEELTLQTPLVVEDESAVQLQLSVSAGDEQGRCELAIYSRRRGASGEGEQGGDGEWTVHASGVLSAGESLPPASGLESFAGGSWPPAGAEELDSEFFYDRLGEAGYHYGSAFQGLRRAFRVGDEIYAEVALEDEQASEASGFHVHPALLDSALHALVLQDLDAHQTTGEPQVPFSFSGVHLYGHSASSLRVRIRTGADGVVGLLATDPQGAPVLSIDSLQTRAIDQGALVAARREGEDLYELGWVELVAQSSSGSPLQAVALGEAIQVPGIEVESYQDLEALEHAIERGAVAPELVLVRAGALMEEDPDAHEEELACRTHVLTARVLELLQMWLASGCFQEARLVLVTQGAVAVGAGEDVPGLAQSPVWGLVRSAQSEHPERFALIDIDGEASCDVLDGALALNESQLAIRGGAMYVPRLARVTSAGVLEVPVGVSRWRLDAGGNGTLEDLSLVPAPGVTEPLGSGQVRVGVRAGGLNFRDVLIALGMYPGEATVGSEGAGVVLELGPGVQGLSIGDRVMGLLAGGLGPVSVADHRLVARIPEGWSFAQAASVPIAFLTAYYGLVDLAGLEEGEKVLVHAAAGGVGMAAVQIAKYLGAEVFGTASPGKWGTLRRLGLDQAHIASSRTLEFKESFLEEIGGEGVDVVLDALAGEFVDASLELLSEGGRFIEMGKTDVRDRGDIARAHPGVAYRAFDLIEAGPERIQQMLGELVDLFQGGVLEPLPLTAWDIRRAPEAFRFMSQARHTGKIVLSLPSAIVNTRGTVLITGGTGTLGALLARHLVEVHGVGHLLLASRRGEDAEGAPELKAELQALGASIRIATCDVSDREDLAGLLDSVSVEHPLSAVVHTAGVLDDGVIGSLTAERLDGVLAPKVDAAWYLHELTEHMDLSLFVLFSSAAGTLGSPGQGNYAAANAFLDALAAQRRARGLAGTSIAWGLWEGMSGMTGGLSEADRSRMTRSGMGALSAERGLELFDGALDVSEALMLAAPLDLAMLRAQARMGVLPAVLSGLVRMPAQRAASGGSLARRLAGVAEAEREGVVLEIVRGQVAAVLGHASPEAVPEKGVFKDLGFDSLAAVELRNRLNQATGLRLPATLAFDYPTTTALAGYLLGEVSGTQIGVAVPSVSVTTVDEPVAIVGMSCRYPGGVLSPEQLWELIASGTDAISSFPSDRGWDIDGLYDPDPDHPGTSYAREGGFLYDAGEFDASFFAIGPREALAMDPQQRLLLEASWEALEDAGIDPVSLKGSQTGVFAGIGSSYYGVSLSGSASEGLDGYGLTGNAGSVASGRVAYTFGFEGPAMSVDTACSSSLVALHLASQALRSGECSLALAGGVTVMASPGLFLEFSLQRGLSPDGRCKSFADAADGVGWSEGVGVLLLERLSDAQRKGHNVLGLVRGSAVNQDGASNGLTAPNGPSQQRVIAQALANARLSAGQVDVVEAHGTGTILGDPIEAQALLATYGQNRERPLWLGSVKSNIGHSVAAAGVAGVIKMVMAMRHGVLPKTLHVDEPSTNVDWTAGAVSLLREQMPWESNGEPRRAGVSSFGISGTNAHVILEEAPAGDPNTPAQSAAVLANEGGVAVVASNGAGVVDRLSDGPLPATPLRAGVLPWVLSGKSAGALRGQAGRLRKFLLDGPASGFSVADVGFSLARRSLFEHRAVVLGGERDDLLGGLDALAQGASASGVVEGVAPVGGAGDGVVFLFPGQGSQWEGMAVELLDSSPVFAEHMRECADALAPHVDWSLEDVLRGAKGAPGFDRVDVVQPALFAVMVSLAGLWRSCGVRPDVVVGHSQGEIAAAHVAGGLSLEDAARVVALRSQILVGLTGKGGMVSVSLGAAELGGLLERWGDQLAIAAVNGPSSVVAAGDPQALQELLEYCEAEGLRARSIPVDYASHSPQVESIREELLKSCSSIVPRSGDVRFYSTVTGGLLDTSELGGEYWYRSLRETVQFEQVTRALLDDRHRSFIEVSPHPVLTVGVQESIDESLGDPGEALVIGSLRRDEGGPERFVSSLAQVWVRGVSVDWAAMFEGSGTQRVGLPTYAFQRERYWLQSTSGAGDMAAAGQASADHPLLSAGVALADDRGFLFTGRISLASHPWLADHAVMGTVLLPGTAFLELALHAGGQVGCERLEELTLETSLVLSEQGAVQLQVSVGELDESGQRPVEIYSRAEDTSSESLSTGEEWTRHAGGVLASSDALAAERRALRERAAALAGESWPPEGAQAVEVDDLYDELAGMGLEYGPVFQGLQAAWRRGEEVFAEVALSEDQWERASSFGVHPALLDGALHASVVSFRDAGGEQGQEQGGTRLPFSFSGVELYASGASSLRVSLSQSGAHAMSLVAADVTGGLIASVDSLVVREFSGAQLGAARGAHSESLFAMNWTTVPVSPDLPAADLVVLGAECSALAGTLADAGRFVEVHADLQALGETLGEDGTVPEAVFVDCAPDGMGVFGDGAPEDRPLGDGASEVGTYAPDRLTAAHQGTRRVLELLQDWLSDERFSDSRLVLITRGAVVVEAAEDLPGLAQSPVWGLVRSAQSENPDRFVLVDIDGKDASSAVLSAALSTGEPQLALREGVVCAPRLARVGSDGVLPAPAGVSRWRLDAGSNGTLEDLSLVPALGATEPLGSGRVRVGVRAGGLNFRDVLIALGMYPGEATVGSEAAGVVLEVGPGVARLATGDRVMGLIPGAFGPIAISDSQLLVKIPARWSFAEAASVPVAFLTAYHGLVDLAGLRKGEKVLVHAATGGVGMAAVQIARHLGAEVFGTASPGKWDTLQRLGLDRAHIASSRTLEFKERFLEETGGEGMDVILDSLAGEFVDASLELLAKGGRFVEMGKTDIRDPEEVAERNPGVSYRAFDLIEAGPERIEEMLGELLELFEAGVLKPLPVRTWDIRRAPEAFRFMSQARHTGKIVLTLPSAIDSQGTVLITGGTGTLGALLARHLVTQHGVRHLLLVSRRGPDAEGALELEGELTALGAQVRIAACDVADRDQLKALIDSVAEEHPLRTVAHTAGVLDDAVIGSLTAERLDGVLTPKADAAWHLHELTEHLDLQAFVLFSSITATLGGPGQGNYAAANAFLDALAAHRRARGLAGISMAWGLWEDASGMTGSLSEADRSRITRSGMGTLSSERGLELFDLALDTDQALILVAPLDLASLRTQARVGVLPAVLGGLVRVPISRAASEQRGGSLPQRLAATPQAEREGVVLEIVRTQVAAVLGHTSAETIDTQRAFKELGFDSLAAVELRNRLNQATGLRLSATLVFDYPTATALAGYLLGQLSGAMSATDLAEMELKGLETKLSSLSFDDVHRRQITVRLQALLAGFAMDDDVNDDDDLAAATADEVFELMDRELGAI